MFILVPINPHLHLSNKPFKLIVYIVSYEILYCGYYTISFECSFLTFNKRFNVNLLAILNLVPFNMLGLYNIMTSSVSHKYSEPPWRKAMLHSIVFVSSTVL